MSQSRKTPKSGKPCRGSHRAVVLCLTVRTNARLFLSLASRYTDIIVDKEEIIQNAITNSCERFEKMTDSEFIATNHRNYICQVIRNEGLTFIRNRNKLSSIDDCLNESDKQLQSEYEHEIQRSEMEDLFIDYHQQIKKILSAEDFEILHRWGVLEQKYDQITNEMGLSESKVRNQVHRIRKELKAILKKFWR
jgi:RNA polymerase sigma factor (sigma-70 family)